MPTIGSVGSLHRFAVKSMAGESLEAVEIDAEGVVGDRTWALRDTETDKLVSAKRPRPWAGLLSWRATGTGDAVRVGPPDGPEMSIVDPALPPALTAAFGREVVVEQARGPQQGVYASEWPEIEGLSLAGEVDFPTNLASGGADFVDVEVLHLLTTASLRALSELVPGASVDVARFRPSMVLDTPDLSGFVENVWEGARLRVGEVEVAIGTPTPRCVMPTLTQPGLAAAPEILRALARHNRVENPFGAFACLGAYATVVAPGTVRVGDPVTMA